jgi:hypothetical protein
MDFEVHRQGAEFQPLVDGIEGDLRSDAERRTESQRRVGPVDERLMGEAPRVEISAPTGYRRPQRRPRPRGTQGLD